MSKRKREDDILTQVLSPELDVYRPQKRTKTWKDRIRDAALDEVLVPGTPEPGPEEVLAADSQGMLGLDITLAKCV